LLGLILILGSIFRGFREIDGLTLQISR